MTESELRQYTFFIPTQSLTCCIDLAMTSGFSTIAGSVLTAYINLGVPAQNLVTSSVMSIPASIAISKMRLPETQEPVTRGRVTVDRGDEGKSKPVRVEFANCIVFKNVQLTIARQMLFMLSVRVPYLVSSLPVRFCEDLIVQSLRDLINKYLVPMSCVSWPWLPRSYLPIDS
jgi:nucleoside permease NupC